MSCPFKHLWPGRAVAPAGEASGTAAEQAPAAGTGTAARCPFSRTTVSGGSSAGEAEAQLHAAGVRGPPAEPAATLQPPTPASGAEAAAAGQCPFLAGMGSVSVQPPAAGGGVEEAPAAQAAPPAAASGTKQQQQGDVPPAVCPLGFGSSRQPRLGQFHCMICKSLYYDCTLTNCGHRYCAGCIRGCRDCPSCGADITELTPDAETQAMVEQYIEAHAGSHTIWELEGSIKAGSSSGSEGQQGAGVEGLAGERSRSAFLLQLGLRAIAAGNIDSARHRFQQCQAELECQLQQAEAEAAAAQAQPLSSSGIASSSTGGGSSEPQQQQQQTAVAAQALVASLKCRLGAVSGCLGDCCRGEGDAAGTLAHYQCSVELLRGAGEDPEAQQALSVSLNKVGELHHLQGDLQAAASLYQQALQLRRALLEATQQQWQRTGGGSKQHAQPATGSGSDADAGGGAEVEEACCSAALDLAASCLKLAGATRGLGQEEEAEALLSEAEDLLGSLRTGLPSQPLRLQHKHASLAQFAGMMACAAQQQQQ